MTAIVQELLDTFDRLTDSERLDLLLEILKRTIHLDFPPLSDEDSPQCRGNFSRIRR